MSWNYTDPKAIPPRIAENSVWLEMLEDIRAGISEGFLAPQLGKQMRGPEPKEKSPEFNLAVNALYDAMADSFMNEDAKKWGKEHYSIRGTRDLLGVLEAEGRIKKESLGGSKFYWAKVK